jgi:hypothetical protein
MFYISLSQTGGSRADLWWVGREKFLKRDFFNYIKMKNHKKWESEKKIGKDIK